jgi:peptidoglycan/LPS O-acetylase OafA/YrhL
VTTERPAPLRALESLRFVAAAAIVVYHLYFLTSVRTPDWMTAVIFPLGLYGVPLFFLISAFVLWHGYVQDGRIRGGVPHYLRRRFFRIAPLYYVVLILQLTLMDTGSSPGAIAAAFLFIFNLIPGQSTGIVFASWSIGVEMLFYALLPPLAFAVRSLWQAIAFFCLSVIAATWVWIVVMDRVDLGQVVKFTPSQWTGYLSLPFSMPFFAAGIVAAIVFRTVPGDRLPTRALLGGGVVGVAALWVFDGVTDGFTIALRVGWCFVLGAIVLVAAVDPPRFLTAPVMRGVGRASFSVYLLHVPVILWLERRGVYGRLADWFGPANYVVACVVTLAVVVPLALLTYQLIERPGMRLGGRGAIAAASPRAVGYVPAPAT